MIKKRLNRLSTGQKTFNNANPNYQFALHQSKFKHKLEYEKKTNPINKKKQKQTRILEKNL